jgi:hypothetical protein
LDPMHVLLIPNNSAVKVLIQQNPSISSSHSQMCFKLREVSKRQKKWNKNAGRLFECFSSLKKLMDVGIIEIKDYGSERFEYWYGRKPKGREFEDLRSSLRAYGFGTHTTVYKPINQCAPNLREKWTIG